MSSHDLSQYKIVEAGANLPPPYNFKRNIVITIDDIDKLRQQYKNTGIYITQYRACSEDIRNSPVYSDLYFDFDKKGDFEAVREDALMALSYLKTNMGVPYDVPRIYFSGCKGVHITVDGQYLGIVPSVDLNEVYRLIAKDISAALPNKTLDTAIYDKVRLFRIVNSKHQESGLYKIPLTYQELKQLTYDEIKRLAESQREEFPRPNLSLNSRAAYFISRYVTKLKVVPMPRRIKPIELSGMVGDYPPCIKELINNGAPKGSRNIAATVLSSYYKQVGYDINYTAASMLDWNLRLDEPLDENEILRCVSQVFSNDYSYGCPTLQDISTCDTSSCTIARRMKDLAAQPAAQNITPIKPVVTNYTDYEKEMLDIIDNVEKYNWNRCSLGGLTFADEALDKAFNGLQPGIYLIAGQPNIGKSIFLLRLAWNVAMNNENVYVLYFSLDDPDIAVLPRIMAMDQQIPIELGKIPERYLNSQALMNRRALAVQRLKDSVNRFKVLDGKFGYSIDHIVSTTMAHKAMLEAKGSNKQLCIFIDSIYDITCDLNFTNDNARLSYVAQELARLYKTHQIPIVGTGHLKKINDTRRPISDDLKDTVNLQFQASAIMLCYNEVKVKAERAEVYHIVAGLEGKQPVLEVYIDKNKLGEFHGRLFYNMYPTYSLLDPATREAGKLYSAKIAM